MEKDYKTIVRLPDGEAQGLEFIELNGKTYLLAWVSNIGYIIKI